MVNYKITSFSALGEFYVMFFVRVAIGGKKLGTNFKSKLMSSIFRRQKCHYQLSELRTACCVKQTGRVAFLLCRAVSAVSAQKERRLKAAAAPQGATNPQNRNLFFFVPFRRVTRFTITIMTVCYNFVVMNFMDFKICMSNIDRVSCSHSSNYDLFKSLHHTKCKKKMI